MLDAAAADFRVPPDRFGFAPTPEHAFIAGLAETVQLGIWQLDPQRPATSRFGWSGPMHRELAAAQRDSLDVARFERATFRNLALNSTRIGPAEPPPDHVRTPELTIAHSERVSQPLRFRRPYPHRADLATASDASKESSSKLCP